MLSDTIAAPTISRATTRIGIVGAAPSAVNAPWGDPGWDLWGMNANHLRPQHMEHVQAGHYAAWFDLHQPDLIVDKPAHVAWLQEDHGFPVWMMPDVPALLGVKVPNLRVYPRQEMRRRYVDYYTSTPAWLLAMAIAQVSDMDGAEIGVWGVDATEAYAQQRPSLEHFLGVAHGKGVKVTIPDTSELLKTGGAYPETHPIEAPMRARLADREAEADRLRAQIADLTAQLHRTEGEVADLRHWLAGWFDAPRCGA